MHALSRQFIYNLFIYLYFIRYHRRLLAVFSQNCVSKVEGFVRSSDNKILLILSIVMHYYITSMLFVINPLQDCDKSIYLYLKYFH